MFETGAGQEEFRASLLKKTLKNARNVPGKRRLGETKVKWAFLSVSCNLRAVQAGPVGLRLCREEEMCFTGKIVVLRHRGAGSGSGQEVSLG